MRWLHVVEFLGVRFPVEGPVLLLICSSLRALACGRKTKVCHVWMCLPHRLCGTCLGTFQIKEGNKYHSKVLSFTVEEASHGKMHKCGEAKIDLADCISFGQETTRFLCLNRVEHGCRNDCNPSRVEGVLVDTLLGKHSVHILRNPSLWLKYALQGQHKHESK